MKLTTLSLSLSLVLLCSSLSAQTQPEITTYSLTTVDCDPIHSMLMLVRPQGFVCIPGSYIIITAQAPVTIYDAVIQFQRANGTVAQEHTLLRVESGQAHWSIYETGVRILSVTAVPLVPQPIAITRVF